MTPIKLTERHKSKLLEMCNKLFPEYDEIDIHGSNIYFNITNYIHWFEFCMTYLSEKIYGNKEECPNFYRNHPIDCLYKHFKKLK